ncbi:hypothetical protein [Cyclobacterium marinum]|uniref:Uncharacterized protein n=1 Tax=Cyclobacterium marinum (strain ATCC 25205 / DSM 745 / LMG 13164 / NCIMB 1802) TaxID=880070 RepID=G0J7N3_CYCMS|nr:hypothetical protein [Cyclobacterium marinum]AEL26986.1 hypothetical protein Cycma_3258 [Cyclobacterium marinum DSM 745]
MEFESLIWGYLPILIALTVGILSVRLILKKQLLLSVFLFLIILGSKSLAAYILVSILVGAWPSFMPHIIISFSILLLLVQKYLHSRSQSKINEKP